MCSCNPDIKTPYCGRMGCNPPKVSEIGKQSSFEKLYRAQCEEHQKTHDKLRETESVVRALRSELMTVNNELGNCLTVLNGIADNIMKAYPRSGT